MVSLHWSVVLLFSLLVALLSLLLLCIPKLLPFLPSIRPREKNFLWTVTTGRSRGLNYRGTEVKNDFLAGVIALAQENPARFVNLIRNGWPEIKAAIDQGHTLKVIHERLVKG